MKKYFYYFIIQNITDISNKLILFITLPYQVELARQKIKKKMLLRF